MRRLSTCAVIVLAIIVSASTARAQPRVALSVVGACPSVDAVRTALHKEKLNVGSDPAAPWLLSVSTHLNGARLTISQDGTETTMTREVFSNDCAAIADTFALIAAIYVRAREPIAPKPQAPAIAPKPQTPAIAPGPQAPAIAPKPQAPAIAPGPQAPAIAPGPQMPAIAPGPQMPPALIGEPGLRVVTHVKPPRDAPIIKRHNPAPWRLGVAAGLNSMFAPDAQARFGQLDVGYERADRWGARLALTQDGTTGFPGTSMQRAETGLNLSLTRTMAGQRMWWMPAVGAGFAVSTVEISSVGSATRLLPTLNAAVASGFYLTERVSLRAELGARLFPIADTYTSATFGVVGESPRASMTFSMGLQLR